MSKFVSWTIDSSLANATLAAVLRQRKPGLSWADARQLVVARHVQVNGNLCLDPARRLKSGESVRLWSFPQTKPPDEDDVRLVYVDESVVVVDKPAGLTTLRHAEERDWPERRRSLQPTLDELLPRLLLAHAMRARPSTGNRSHGHPLRARLGRIKVPGNKPAPPQRFGPRLPRVRAVHRLDRDTSGLMVFALTPAAEQSLVAQFKAHSVARAYRAVVHGHPSPQTIRSWLVRDRGDGLRGSTRADPPPADAQLAITHVKPIEPIGEYHVVECRLETGRTHQIRIHLAEAGHMLCGEKVYHHAPGEPAREDRSEAPRHALHAYELGFVHPATGRQVRFTSDWPEELAAWLARLRQRVGGTARASSPGRRDRPNVAG